MMMMMQSGVDDITKQRMLQARALSQEARGSKFGCIHVHLECMKSGSELKHILVFINTCISMRLMHPLVLHTAIKRLHQQLGMLMCVHAHNQTVIVCDHSWSCQM